MMKKVSVIIAALLLLVAGLAGGCGNTDSTGGEKKKLVFGVAPGPYGDMIKYAVRPGLEKKGYTVEVKEFSDYVQPNLALQNKELDANLFQHRLYLEKFSADKGLKLSAVVNVPTAGIGIYSRKIAAASPEELKTQLKTGDEITLANDPTNLARALRLLAKHGLIAINPAIDQAKASEKDITANPYGLKVSPLEAAQLPRSLDSAPLAVINGNFAIAAGIPLSTAIIKEELTEEIKNLIAVRTEDLDKQFVKDIKEVVEGEGFKAAIEDTRYPFKEFQKPEWYTKKWGIH